MKESKVCHELLLQLKEFVAQVEEEIKAYDIILCKL
jgi:hypothetical protein